MALCSPISVIVVLMNVLCVFLLFQSQFTQTCGNSIVERGEECDCGSQQVKTTSCVCAGHISVYIQLIATTTATTTTTTTTTKTTTKQTNKQTLWIPPRQLF